MTVTVRKKIIIFFLINFFKIHWPLKLNSKRNSDDWILYVLEEPVIRHNGEIRKCKSIESNLINPLNIYNDETLRLTYNSENYLRKPRSVSKVTKKILKLIFFFIII